jgi:parallel beta-helix repeat protein
LIRNCVARGNGQDGLFLCWRVRHGVFEDNELVDNGRHGISIGHKDSDNLLRKNRVRGNASYGVLFRNESEGMAGHRNRLEQNQIENNGVKTGGAGIFIDGETDDVVLVGNIIRDTRQSGAQTQRVGIRLGKSAGKVKIDQNQISAAHELEDLRAKH